MRAYTLSLILAFASLAVAEDAKDRLANTVILDAAGVANLRIQTVEVEETTFEQTVFALGRIDVLPGKRAIVSSRIAGRAFSVLALPHQEVKAGAELVWVESRQPGDPPPTVMLPAPMAGVIAKVDIAQGQPITPDQSLVEIIDLSSVEASAHVPQHLAARLKKDQVAHIRVAALPEKVFEAKLSHLGVYADAQTGTLEAAFHVPNPDKLLRPGMLAEFNIAIDRRENVVSIPREALQGDASSRFVYVKDYDLKNAFVKVTVQIGEQNDRFVEVLKGLLPGDEVVTRGAYSLAFAGKGSVSLKEAMDAAHGHPHNEDGSEVSKEGQKHQDHGSEGDHHHDHGGGDSDWSFNRLTLFFAASTGLLLLLLILSVTLRKRTAL